jgi:hypothetical protein
MKKFFKPILLIALIVILAVIVIVPTKSYSADVTHLPGYKGSGPYGDTCWCPWFPFDCGCAVAQQ